MTGLSHSLADCNLIIELGLDTCGEEAQSLNYALDEFDNKNRIIRL